MNSLCTTRSSRLLRTLKLRFLDDGIGGSVTVLLFFPAYLILLRSYWTLQSLCWSWRLRISSLT